MGAVGKGARAWRRTKPRRGADMVGEVLSQHGEGRMKEAVMARLPEMTRRASSSMDGDGRETNGRMGRQREYGVPGIDGKKEKAESTIVGDIGPPDHVVSRRADWSESSI